MDSFKVLYVLQFTNHDNQNDHPIPAETYQIKYINSQEVLNLELKIDIGFTI